MSGSISNFFNDLGNELEDAVGDAATEIGDAADDVRNDTDGNNNAAAPQPVQPPVPQPVPAPQPTEGGDAPVARLYQAAFDRAPDAGGLAFWTSALQAGVGLGTIADQFVATPEFQTRYAPLGTDQFVDSLYLNTLDRPADPAGRAFWTGVIESGGADRGDVLLGFSQAPEFVARVGTGNDDPLV